MRYAAFVVALFTLVVVGIGGFIWPERGTEIRRLYFATPWRLYTAAVVRMAMGLVVLLAASRSRAPGILRAMGAIMSLQGISAAVLGPEHARAVLEWETSQGTAVLRVGAAIAFAAGGFLIYALTGRRPEPDR